MLSQDIQLHNLPPQPTPFIGREPEIAEIVELLTDVNCRLLTLLGPGGIGKTRLSIESISRLSESDFEHGVFYVPLAPLTSADNIVTTVIGVLGIMIGEDGTPQEELVKFLSGRNLLLVMDNFEHVLDGADLVADILNLAPHVKVLVTSREALNLRVERVWHVQGMRYPDSDLLDDINHYSALKLFIDRATWVRRDFSVDMQLPCAIQICQLVGGMPLAIELSASWLKTLSCQDIIQEITRGLDFLSTRARDIPDRHRSIRAVFDHSWNLLSPDEQAVFPRLSVFRGGFTRDAAAQVANATLITLSGLVEKSMVRCDATGRYDVHELLRQYAEEKLRANDEIDATLSAYTSYFADFMRENAIDIKGRDQIKGLQRIDSDFDNIIEVWQQAIHRANSAVLDDMMEALALFVDIRAKYQIGESLFQQALTQLGDLNRNDINLTLNRLRVRYVQTWILQERKPIPVSIHRLIEGCLHIASVSEDLITTMLCYWCKGELARIDLKFKDAIPNYETTRQLSQQLGLKYYEGRTLRGLDFIYTFSEIALGSHIPLEHQEITHQIGDIAGLSHALNYHCAVLYGLGQYDKLRQIWLRVVDGWEKVQDTKSLGMAAWLNGQLYFTDGLFAEAERVLVEAEKKGTQTNFLNRHTHIYSVISIVYAIQGQYEQSLQSIQNARNYEEISIADPFHYLSMVVYATCMADFETVRTYLTSTLHMGVSQLRDYIIMLSVYSFLLNNEKKSEQAVEILGLIFMYPKDITGWMYKWNLLIELEENLKSELGDEAYQDAWERGAQRDLEETVDELIAYLSDDDTQEPRLATSQPLAEPLTERELEVLALIADGLTNPQIADKLFLSTGTVKVHTRNIYGKLNVSNRTEASTVARKLGLI